MASIKLTKKVQAANHYKEYVRQYATFIGQPVSEKEVDVLDSIYWKGHGLLSSEVRKAVQEDLDISEYNLNNYIHKLRGKHLIVPCKDTKGERLNEDLSIAIKADSRELNFYFTLQS